MTTILLAEDDPLQREVMKLVLHKQWGYDIVEAENGKQAVSYIEQHHLDALDLVLLDISMPVMDGFETLAILRKYRPDLPIIMLTAADDTTLAVKAIKAGAVDFIVKPAEPEHLHIAIQNALRLSTLAREVMRLRRAQKGALLFKDIIGYQHGLAESVARGRKAAASDATVLLLGETGVGKELFARAIHGESNRVGAPFITINCGAIPTHLVESTLFGHEKGAFTSATSHSIGKFREADGGTIFLDEIGELPLDAQAKLLRVLQEKEVEPVGAVRPIRINVRVISATHRDLQAEVLAGRFREDLYFRMHVLPITLPPLRDRKHDIALLANYFIQRIAGEENTPVKHLSPEQLQALQAYDWPGNVRELENTLRRAVVLSEHASLDINDLPTTRLAQPISSGSAPLFNGVHEVYLTLTDAQGHFKSMVTIEHEAYLAALNLCQQNVTHAARLLGVAKSTFYRKMAHRQPHNRLKPS